MRRAVIGLLAALLAPIAAHGGAPQSYDATCSTTCIASDGKSPPPGTVLFRFSWDGASAYTPVDAVGAPLSAVLDEKQTTPVYLPKVSAPLGVTTAPTSVPVVSSGQPDLSGSYGISANDILNITAIETGINAGKGFPGGISSLTYVGADGMAHVFSSTDEFTALAVAIEGYVSALELNGLGHPTRLPATPLQIP